MRLLVSVRDMAEAREVAAAGVDFIDLKEPRGGALGAVALPLVCEIVLALRTPADSAARASRSSVSATIGDRPDDAHDEMAWTLPRVQAMAACGVDLVKVGITPGPQAACLLEALATCGAAVVPVFIADGGIDARLYDHACGLGFPALMLDTADKQRGSLFDVMEPAALRRCIAAARHAGVDVGVAGALQMAHWPALRALAPSYAGFRTAVCDSDRTGALVPARLQALIAAARVTTPA